MKLKKYISLFFAVTLTVFSAFIFDGCGSLKDLPTTTESTHSDITEAQNENTDIITLNNLPDFSGTPFVAINDNAPYFTKEDYTTKSYEKYSPLDLLGRCGVVEACIGHDLMPTDERGSIGQVKPSGWVTAKYDFVDGKYLYNRCHLIGWQLTGENANERNLVTGTRYMNTEGMLPFENMVADYIKETGNHVLYRVTPIFKDSELVARGVTIEAYSVEDDGDGICFNVYCYNNQPNIEIDYKTGKSKISESPTTTLPPNSEEGYVLNTSSKKFHLPDCSSVKKIDDKNKDTTNKTREQLIDEGYDPCGACKP